MTNKIHAFLILDFDVCKIEKWKIIKYFCGSHLFKNQELDTENYYFEVIRFFFLYGRLCFIHFLIFESLRITFQNYVSRMRVRNFL